MNSLPTICPDFFWQTRNCVLRNINNFTSHPNVSLSKQVALEYRWVCTCTPNFTNFLWKLYFEHITSPLIMGILGVQISTHAHLSYSDINKWNGAVWRTRWSTDVFSSRLRSGGWDSCGSIEGSKNVMNFDNYQDASILPFQSSKLLYFIILMIGILPSGT